MEEKTLKEFQEYAQKTDIWWSPVITPKEVFLSEIASSANAIAGEGHEWSIQCPVQMK